MNNSDSKRIVFPIRLWPGIVIVAVQWLARFVLPIALPGSLTATAIAVLGGVAGGIGVIVWWTFFSRATGRERGIAPGLVVVAMAATYPLLDESISTGAMGFLFFLLATPVLSLTFVLWAAITRNMVGRRRLATMAATILLTTAAFSLLRTGGFTGSFNSDLAWRWAPTPEELLLAETDELTALPEPAAATAVSSASAGETASSPVPAAADSPTEAATAPESHPPAEWPSFRGSARTGVIPGVRIATDWSQAPPVELWRRPVGPGWSSFSVDGELFFTQEQRGEEEVVTAYRMDTGDPVWRHRDTARFWESNGGAGPRGTPTIHDGRIYTFGATGILNVLEETDGTLVWSRNVGSDAEVAVSIWGFSSSPLVVDDLVIVAAAGKLAAYDRATGDLAWSGPDGGEGYSSPHLVTIDGVRQVLLTSPFGVVAAAPESGAILWEHPWPSAVRIVQPALTGDGELLISRGGTMGMRRIAVHDGPRGWEVEERWTSNRLKPYFSDFVVHKGHAYGFDGSILAAIDVSDGERMWKGGRYGQGQLVLLPDQDLLLVLTEQGELALVEAVPDGFSELARFPAIAGKTWNHPVLVGDTLLVRNGEEMAAFRLTLAGG